MKEEGEKSATWEVFVFACRWAFQAWKAGAACLGEGDDGRVGHAKSGSLQGRSRSGLVDLEKRAR